VSGDTGSVFLPDRKVLPSGKARIRHVWVIFLPLCSLSVRSEGEFLIFKRGRGALSKRIGIVGIVVEDLACVERVNAVLHEYSSLIVGRMGLPYRERGVSVISLIVDGSNDEISALTGKLGRISGATVKSMIAKTNQ
jgi:putative iron-only hydrogenase system regulator